MPTASLNKLYLASRSPRRRELLKQIGIAFDVMLLREYPPARRDIDEAPQTNEAPDQYVLRIARLKAETANLRIGQRRVPALPVLAADTSVALEGTIIGKPADATAATGILRRLSGKTHQVLSAVAIAQGEELHSALSVTEVTFATLTDDELRAYVATGEPMDKAGAYGVQGRAGAFIANLAGSYSGVVGLPLYETVQLLKKIRFPL